MAKKKKTLAGSPGPRSSSDIIRSLGIVSGKTLLEGVWPERQINRRSQNILRFPCPIHGDADPSMDIDFIEGFIYCYGCHYHTRSFLQFFKDAQGWSFKETIERLRQYPTVKLFSDTVTNELVDRDIHSTATQIMGTIDNQYLQYLISGEGSFEGITTAIIEAAQPVLDWLFGTRRLSKELAYQMPYGLLPPGHIQTKLIEEWFNQDVVRRQQLNQPLMEKTFREKVVERIDAMLKDVDGSWMNSVVFITGYSFTAPGRIRLRKHNVDKAEGLKILPGFEDGDPTGFFGLYSSSFSGFSEKSAQALPVFMVEGEFDALSIMEGMKKAGKANALVIASCGTANETDQLIDAGIKKIYLISDEPSAELGKGNEWTRSRLTSAIAVDAFVFSRWTDISSEAPTAKDPDDAVHALGFDKFYQLAMSDIRAKYQTAIDWSLDRINDEIRSRRVSADDVRSITEIAGRYGQCVAHPAVQSAFIERVAQLFNISPGPLRQQIVQAHDTEEAFRLRITERLKYELYPICKETSAKGQMVTTYHRTTKQRIVLPMHDGEAIGVALASVHGNIYNYVKNFIGIPAFLETSPDGVPCLTPEKTLIKDIYFYLKLGVQDMIMGLRERKDCMEYGQGAMLLEDPARPGEQAVYLVNGLRVYKGWFIPGTKGLHWEELPGPADGPHLFRTRADPWSVEINDVNDLIQGNSITKEDVFAAITKVIELIDKNWTFAHQDTDPIVYAYHLFASTVSCAFPVKAIFAINGDQHSGKSTLLSWAAGLHVPKLQILEACEGTTNYSAASFYQHHDGSSISAAMDEFEDSGDITTQKGREVTNISEMMRGLVGEKGVRIGRGTNTGDGSIVYRLNMNVFISSILRARQAQDDSRRFDIEMRKDESRRSPEQGVFSMISLEELRNIRRLMSIGFYKFIPQLRAEYDKLDKAINTTDIIPFKVPTRYIDNMLQACSVMSFLDQDWKSLIVRVCETRKMKIQAIAADTASSVLFDRLFYTPGIRMGDIGRAVAAIIELLADPKEAAEINSSRCGIFFIPDKNLAVVNWIRVQAKGGLLDYWPEYKTMDHRNLKHTFDQSNRSLRTEEYESAGVKEFLQQRGEQFRPDLISVVNLDDLIKEIRSKRVTERKPEMNLSNVITLPRRVGTNTGSGNLE